MVFISHAVRLGFTGLGFCRNGDLWRSGFANVRVCIEVWEAGDWGGWDSASGFFCAWGLRKREVFWIGFAGLVFRRGFAGGDGLWGRALAGVTLCGGAVLQGWLAAWEVAGVGGCG